MSVCPEELKLIALDKDDIEVVSAHVQDAAVRVSDIFWMPREHRFVVAVNRFDWMSAIDTKADYRRCRTALRFDRVLACKYRNIDQTSKDARLNLLAVEFVENDTPAGVASWIFSGGGIIRLDVECLDEDIRVMVSSVTEGEDKPLKYPLMFRTCDLVIVNKVDLLPHLDYDLDRFLYNLDAVHPDVERMLVSARTGEGMEAWREWLVHAAAREGALA